MGAIDTASKPWEKKAQEFPKFHLLRLIVPWLSSWEIYPILFCAILLHFYGLTTTEFDADQAILWRLPRMAVVHGLIPATGTIASIGMVNPPGYVYLLMLITAFTANPFADVIFTALLNVLAVVLTYVFTRCYYGRLAGTVAALLYATTFWDIFYGRFIWQPNLMPFFVVLFMWTLFRGAVEHKSGWLAIALPLLGFMLQLHATPIYLAVPLALTLVLAYRTVRRRDVVIGVTLFALMFSTYAIWERAVHFADLRILLGTSHNPAHIDSGALRFYMDFLVPYVIAPYFPLINNPQGVLYHLVPLLDWEKRAMYIVTAGGFVLAGLGLLGWNPIQLMSRSRFPEDETAIVSETLRVPWKILRWWNALSASPQRCGFLLLLSWQIFPLLFVLRHTVALQSQYFMIFLPGPFILIGLLFSQVTLWCKQIKGRGRILRFVVPAISLLMVFLQFTGSFGWFFDEAHGYFAHGYDYDTFQDVQGAINAADHLARSRHLHHVYIDTDYFTYETLKYLAGQMQTPATVLNGSNCLVLPALSQGPAVMLLGPADTLDDALLHRFASATLASEPPRLGGAPFHLYIVQPLPVTPDSRESFVHTLTLSTSRPGAFAWNDGGSATHLFETRWTNLKNLPTVDGTLYTYHFDARYAGRGTDGQITSTECSFTSLTPGEQLLVPFQLPAGSTVLPGALSLSGSSWMTQQKELHYGPFNFESIVEQRTTPVLFESASGGNHLVAQN